MDRRSKFRQGLSPLYTPYYDSLCNLLGPEWQPYSGMRTFEQQHAMFIKKDAITNADAGQSAHNYGCATDWILWDNKDNPIWIPKEDKRWDEYTTAIWKAGLRAGADFGDVDHNELDIGCSWRVILTAYNQGGFAAAQAKIRELTSK